MGQNPASQKAVKAEVVGPKKAKGSGKGKKLGRDKRKCATYRANKEREKHKIIKIARSNGIKAAMKYAAEKGITPWAMTRLKNYTRKSPTPALS